MSMFGKAASKLIRSATKPKPVGRRRGLRSQTSVSAQKKRKAEGKQSADLMQPAAGSVGKGAEQADAGIRPSKVAAQKAGKYDAALDRKEKRLAKLRADSHKFKKGSKEYLNFSRKNAREIDDLKNSIKDMKSRGGPGGRTKIKYKMGGGMTMKDVDKTKNPGLAKLPTPVRNKMGYAKDGGKVYERQYGGPAAGKKSSVESSAKKSSATKKKKRKSVDMNKTPDMDYTTTPKEFSAQAQSKKMGGGKVYKKGHGGKVIKANMAGDDLVKSCYD